MQAYDLSKRGWLFLLTIFAISVGLIAIYSLTFGKSRMSNDIYEKIRRTDPYVLRASHRQRDGGAISFANITNAVMVEQIPATLVGKAFVSTNLAPHSPVPYGAYSNICLDSKTSTFVAYDPEANGPTSASTRRPFDRYGLYPPQHSYHVSTSNVQSQWNEGDRLLPGVTLIAADFGQFVENFFHSLEHLVGLWLNGGQARRMEVRHVAYIIPGRYSPGSPHSMFAPHEMTAHTIKALYPNANILTWESMLAAAQQAPSGRLCMPVVVTSDRYMSYFDSTCMKLNKMLGNVVLQAEEHAQSALQMARRLWEYSGVNSVVSLPSIGTSDIGLLSSSSSMPPSLTNEFSPPRPLRLLYTTRHRSRVFSPELDARIIALLSAIPDVELIVSDFSALPFVEQVQRVASADILFGLHGSGLTHLFWLPPNATVVEIFPENTFALDYRVFARIRGLDYVGLQAAAKGSKPITDAEAFKTGAFGSMTNKQVKVLDLYAVLKVVETVKIRFHGLLPEESVGTGLSVAQDHIVIDIAKAATER